MKYKLIKEFPTSPKIGTIYQKGGDYYTYGLRATTVESYPEFFAPYLFTTLDNKDIFVGDTFYFIDSSNKISLSGTATIYCNVRNFSGKVFSTKEAAQKWIDSQRKPIWKTEDGEDVFENEPVKWVIYSIVDNQWKYHYDLSMHVPGCATTNPETFRVFKNEDKMNKWIEEQNRPKFEKGEWLYVKGESGWKSLLRFDSYNIPDINYFSVSEQYTIYSTGLVEISEYSNKWPIKTSVSTISKATPSQIEEVLSKVAEHKGFKEGVQYKNACDLFHTYTMSSNKLEYRDDDTLFNGYGKGYIYYKGVWAGIVEDIPEYVECVSEYPPIGATKGKIYKAFYQPNSLNPYRWYTNGAASGENGYSTLQMFNQIFKPSTKEAYEAQFQTKELTITLDGDVVDTSHWDNNVKIVYK